MTNRVYKIIILSFLLLLPWGVFADCFYLNLQSSNLISQQLQSSVALAVLSSVAKMPTVDLYRRMRMNEIKNPTEMLRRRSLNRYDNRNHQKAIEGKFARLIIAGFALLVTICSSIWSWLKSKVIKKHDDSNVSTVDDTVCKKAEPPDQSTYNISIKVDTLGKNDYYTVK